MVLRVSLYTSQSPWWYPDYPFTHHSLHGGTQTIPLLIKVCLMVLRLSLYSTQSQTILIHITVSLVVPTLSLYSSQSIWWHSTSLYSSQSPWWHSDYTYTHHILPGGPQTIPLLITVCLMVLRPSLYSSQSLWRHSTPFTQHILPLWYSDYLNTHHSLPGGTQSIPIRITISKVVLTLSLYSSQSPWWYSDYPYTHHSLFGGPQSIYIHTTFCLMVLRVSLYASKSLWWYS